MMQGTFTLFLLRAGEKRESKQRRAIRLTEDIEAGEEERDLEEAVTKESKKETGDDQHNRDNSSTNSNLQHAYFSVEYRESERHC